MTDPAATTTPSVKVSAVQDAAIDSVYEHLLIPMSDSSFWSTDLQLNLQEAFEPSAQRANLVTQEQALSSLIQALNQLAEEGGKQVKSPPNRK